MSEQYKLTAGAIEQMVNGTLKDEQPILQILCSKRMARANNSNQDRYRIVISDGICLYTHAMVSTYKIPPQGPASFTVIRVVKFESKILFERRSDVVPTLLINDIVILADGLNVQEKIGNPILLSEYLQCKSAVAPVVEESIYSKRTSAMAFSDDSAVTETPKRALKEPNIFFTAGSSNKATSTSLTPKSALQEPNNSISICSSSFNKASISTSTSLTPKSALKEPNIPLSPCSSSFNKASISTFTPLTLKSALKEPKNPVSPGCSFNKASTSTSGVFQTAAPSNMYLPKSNNFVIPDKYITPISCLRPRMYNWTIKVRVTNKTDIHTWENTKGSGKLFSVDFLDESGEIRCTAFKDQVDKFYPLLEINKIYYVSKCQTKETKKQYSYFNSDYELSFTNQSTVFECVEVDNAKQCSKQLYNFIALKKVVEEINVGELVDVIGICTFVSDLLSFNKRDVDSEIKKRNVYLLDEANVMLILDLWGEKAESFDGSNEPVIAVKGAKVVEFDGSKNISAIMSTLITINPDIPEALKIKTWYENEEKNNERNDHVPEFEQIRGVPVENARLDINQKVATVLCIESDSLLYKCCPKADCMEKVQILNKRRYRCEKCNEEYKIFKNTYLLNLNIADHMESQWVTLYDEKAEKFFGITADKMDELLNNDPFAAEKVLDKVTFSRFKFRCEIFDEENQIRTNITEVDKLGSHEHNALFLEDLREWLKPEFFY